MSEGILFVRAPVLPHASPLFGRSAAFFSALQKSVRTVKMPVAGLLPLRVTGGSYNLSEGFVQYKSKGFQLPLNVQSCRCLGNPSHWSVAGGSYQEGSTPRPRAISAIASSALLLPRLFINAASEEKLSAHRPALLALICGDNL